MVKKRLIFLSFWILASACTGGLASVEPELRIIIDKAQVEMGKYLLVRLEYSGDHVPEMSNLQQWSDDFFVDRLEQGAEKLSDSRFLYTEKMRLYPRQAGEKVLHAVALGGAIARPVRIMVLPAIRKGIDGTPHWLALPESIWQGQTIVLGIEQKLLHPSNQVSMDKAEFPGFWLEKLDAKPGLEEDVDTLQLRWLINAQSSGTMILEAPMLEQRGRGRWRFYLPRISLNVKPLPSYIPPTVPIGKLSIGTGLFVSKNKSHWQVVLQNQGLLPEEVHGIRMQLAKLSGWPAEKIQLSHSRAELDPMLFAQSYSVPLPEWSLGFLDGPEIFVSYFDVDEGRIKTLSRRLPGVWAMPVIWQYLLGFVFVLVLLLLLKWLIKTLTNLRTWRRYRQTIRQAQESHELRRLLLMHVGCRTLDDWALVAPGTLANHIAGQLNELCFSQSLSRSCKASLEDIKQALLQLYTYRTYQRSLAAAKS